MTRVLVVDDVASMRQLAAYTLKSGGFECTEAKDGEEAWEKCQKQDYDLVIADLDMPKMGGLELSRKLREKGMVSPILLLTTALEHQELASKADVNELIVKPFNPEALLQKIRLVS